MEKTQFFSGILRSVAGDKNPLQAYIEFVFTDFKPNRNREGVRASEADSIIDSGVNMPVKVNFLGDSVANHKDSTPVGTITELVKTDEQILGKATLWRNEFPQLMSYLEKSSASEGGVQFSWELFFKEAEEAEGIKWLKDVKVGAITIVSDPAYAGRTPLLSFAEDRAAEPEQMTVGGLMDPTLESLQEQVTVVTDHMYGMINQLYEALDEARPDPTATDLDAVVAEFKSLMERLRANRTESATKLSETQSELEALREYKTQKEAAEARSALVEARSSALAAVMSAEDIQEKMDFVLTLSEDQFVQFVASLQNVRKSSTASDKTKDRDGRVPDFPSPTAGVGNQNSVTNIAREFMKMRSEGKV